MENKNYTVAEMSEDTIAIEKIYSFIGDNFKLSLIKDKYPNKKTIIIVPAKNKPIKIIYEN